MRVTEFKGLKSDEKLLLVLLLGTLEALLQKQIKPEEVQRILPLGILGNSVSSQVLSLLAESWELEDVNDLIPEKLEESIKDLRSKTLKQLSKYDDYPNDIWLEFSIDKKK